MAVARASIAGRPAFRSSFISHLGKSFFKFINLKFQPSIRNTGKIRSR